MWLLGSQHSLSKKCRTEPLRILIKKWSGEELPFSKFFRIIKPWPADAVIIIYAFLDTLSFAGREFGTLFGDSNVETVIDLG